MLFGVHRIGGFEASDRHPLAGECYRQVAPLQREQDVTSTTLHRVSVAGEDRLARTVLHEAGHADLLVLGGEEPREQGRLEP